MTSLVRTAQIGDEGGIMDLCRLMHAETGLFSFNEAKILRMIRRAWTGDNVIIGLVGPVGAPVACAALVLSDSWYSDDPVLGDLMVFVHPDHRKSGYARELLRFTKKVSERLGEPMTIGVMGRHGDSERTWKARLRLYRQQFGEPVGFFFLHRPDHEEPRHDALSHAAQEAREAA